jgi:hypothetical protein
VTRVNGMTESDCTVENLCCLWIGRNCAIQEKKKAPRRHRRGAFDGFVCVRLVAYATPDLGWIDRLIRIERPRFLQQDLGCLRV